MLVGSDYNTSGLPGWGPHLARRMSQRRHGLAHALCQARSHDLLIWKQWLQEVLTVEGKRLVVPAAFPDMKALGHYHDPAVSTPEQLHNLSGLKHGWDRQIDQPKLRILLRQRFNIWTRGYSWFGSLLIARRTITRSRTFEIRYPAQENKKDQR